MHLIDILNESFNYPKVQSIGTKPVLTRIHYFDVPGHSVDIARQLGLTQNRRGDWVLLQYNTSGSGFNRKFADATRAFGRPRHSDSLKEDIDTGSEPTFISAMRDFLPIAVKVLGLATLPKIKLAKSIKDTHVPTFGRFANESKEITVVIDNRNTVDILRTLAHEMAHFQQGEDNKLDNDSWHTGSPEENEAHELAGIVMREFNKQFPEYLSSEPINLKEGKMKELATDYRYLSPQAFKKKYKMDRAEFASKWKLDYEPKQTASELDKINAELQMAKIHE